MYIPVTLYLQYPLRRLTRLHLYLSAFLIRHKLLTFINITFTSVNHMKTVLTWIKNNHKILLVLFILSCFLFSFSRMAQSKIVVVKADQEKEVVIVGNPKNIKITNKH